MPELPKVIKTNCYNIVSTRIDAKLFLNLMTTYVYERVKWNIKKFNFRSKKM